MKELIDFINFIEKSDERKLLEQLCKLSELIGMSEFRNEYENSCKLKEQRYYVLREIHKRKQ